MIKSSKLRCFAIGVLAFVVFNSSTTSAQIINTVGGTGTLGYSGDGGAAVLANIHHPHGSTVDAAGNFYFGDYDNNRVRKITPSGIITTIAGNGTIGLSPDGSVAATSMIAHPFDVAIDNAGSIYFTEALNQVVRKISPAGTLITIAGNGTTGLAPDSTSATAASLSNPAGIVVDGAGNVYFAEQYNHIIRKVTPSGVMTRIAGNGIPAFGGDGGLALAASLSYPNFLTLDNNGNLLISDNGNHRIRKLDLTTGIISTIIGNGSTGFTGDGGPATAAGLYYPGGVSVSPSGDLFIADNLHNRIRKVNASGTISTVAGNGTASYGGDGGLAMLAMLNGPVDVSLDPSGMLYISDYANHRIRKVNMSSIAVDNPPLFNADGSAYLVVCENATETAISSLGITDIDSGQIEYFSILTGPSHGDLFGLPTSVISTGGIITPVGPGYTPTSGYYGSDTFTIVVNDGINSDTLHFHVDIQPNIVGVVTGVDTICFGDTATMTNSINGGYWSISNATVATISSTGVVTGLLWGVDTVYYVINNDCIHDTSKHLIYIRRSGACNESVSNPDTEGLSINITPNPTNGSFFVTCNNTNNKQLNGWITDMSGRRISNFNLKNNIPLDISLELASGIYFVTITNGSDIRTNKVVVTK